MYDTRSDIDFRDRLPARSWVDNQRQNAAGQPKQCGFAQR